LTRAGGPSGFTPKIEANASEDHAELLLDDHLVRDIAFDHKDGVIDGCVMSSGFFGTRAPNR